MRSLEYALLILQEAELKSCHAFDVAQHHRQTVSACTLRERRVEYGIVCHLKSWCRSDMEKVGGIEQVVRRCFTF